MTRVLNERYRLVATLGGGGMGSVWLAEDLMLGRQVALKELIAQRNPRDQKELRRRALREAQALARVRHPAIVQIFDVIVHENDPWIVMEYISGRSLADLIEAGPLLERTIARIGLKVLGALDAAHGKGVLHRDVKPSNILISEQNQVFLVDFGVAQLTDVSRLTSKNTFVGTVEFMAPERIGQGIEAPAGDLWSLGVTLFCALEGYSPFRPVDDHNVATTILAIMNSPAPEPSRSGPLADAVKMLLRKDPAERMSAAGLNHALRSILVPARASTARAERPHPARSPRPAAAAAAPRPVPTRPPESAEPPGRSARSPARPADSPDDSVQPPAARPADSPGKQARSPARPADSPGKVGQPPARRAEPPAEPPGRSGEAPGPRRAGPGPRARAGRLRDLPPEQAAAMLAGLHPAAARDLLLEVREVDAAAAGPILAALPAQKAAEILAGSPSRVVAGLLTAMAPQPRAAASILQILSAPRAGRAVSYLSRSEAAELLGGMSHAEAARILAETDVRAAAGVLGALPRAFAARVIEAMSIRRACGVLGYVPPATIAALLRATTDGRNETVLRGLAQPVRAQVLRHL